MLIHNVLLTLGVVGVFTRFIQIEPKRIYAKVLTTNLVPFNESTHIAQTIIQCSIIFWHSSGYMAYKLDTTEGKCRLYKKLWKSGKPAPSFWW